MQDQEKKERKKVTKRQKSRILAHIFCYSVLWNFPPVDCVTADLRILKKRERERRKRKKKKKQ